jgi:hypothetical protein
VTPRRRQSVLAVIWAWRKELPTLVCAVLVCITLVRTLGIAWTTAGLSAMVGAFSPPWSERLVACAWQLITPHLLRSGLYHARIQNRDGRRPVIVRVTREPFGERVRLWCPAGTCAEDLHAARGILRAACWAIDVLVTRDERRAHLVTVDVIRRLNDRGHINGNPGELGAGPR